MNVVEQIAGWSEGFLPEGLFLVEVEQKPGSHKISVFIDGENGVTVDDCRKLSRYLGEKLDELDYGDTPYYLEVSSPGIDKPLKFRRQYKKHIGREVMVKLKAASELYGKLDALTDEGIVILLKDKKKGYREAGSKEISFDDVAEVTVLVSFK